MKTKILSLILSLVMVITMVPKLELNVSADNSTITDEQGIKYKLNDDSTATVLGPKGNPKIGTEFVIPAEINGCRVTMIADNAFDINRIDNKEYKYQYDLLSGRLTLKFSSPNYIETIGKEAFRGCEFPAGKIILDSLKDLGDRAFFGCNFANGRARDLDNGYYRDGFNDYDDFEFNSVTIDISKSLTILGRGAFSSCRGLREVKLSENLSNLNRAFVSCFDLEILKIPDGVTRLNDWEFFHSYRVKLNELPPELTEIGMNAFMCCENLGFKKIPDSVVNIEIGAFKNTRFKDGELTFPRGLNKINRRMFECSELRSLYISSSTEEIGAGAFFRSEITNINSSIKGEVNLPTGLKSIPDSMFVSCKNIESVYIPNSVGSIGTSAFSGCSNLRTVNDLKNSKIANIPEGVEVIGRKGYTDGVFKGCSKIKVVNLPKSLKRIEDSAFKDCDLAINAPMDSKVLNLTENVEYIGEEAFEGCKFEEVNISASVEDIGKNAFAGCPLKNIIIPPNSCLERIDDYDYYYREKCDYNDYYRERYDSKEIVNVYIHCRDDEIEEKRLSTMLKNLLPKERVNIINHPYESERCLAIDNNCGGLYTSVPDHYYYHLDELFKEE